MQAAATAAFAGVIAIFLLFFTLPIDSPFKLPNLVDAENKTIHSAFPSGKNIFFRVVYEQAFPGIQ